MFLEIVVAVLVKIIWHIYHERLTQLAVSCSFLWPPCVADADIIFCAVVLLSSSFFLA